MNKKEQKLTLEHHPFLQMLTQKIQYLEEDKCSNGTVKQQQHDIHELKKELYVTWHQDSSITTGTVCNDVENLKMKVRSIQEKLNDLLKRLIQSTDPTDMPKRSSYKPNVDSQAIHWPTILMRHTTTSDNGDDKYTHNHMRSQTSYCLDQTVMSTDIVSFHMAQEYQSEHQNKQ